MSQGKRWCFTLNNYTSDHEDSLRALECKYLVYGKETAPTTGTKHLQGFVIFNKNMRLPAVSKVLQAHWALAKGTSKQASDYCKKEDSDFFEKGSFPGNAGRRSDLQDLMEAVRAGTHDIKQLRSDFPDVCAKFPRFVSDFIRDQIPDPDIPEHDLRPWQKKLEEMLSVEPDDRKVVFVVDYDGNKGKSWFAKRYCKNCDKSMLMRPGKHADMAYMLPPVLRVLFLDCTRKQVEYMPYTFMEELKDGYVSSTKYESCIKKYPRIHVVVLMNQDPDMEALSPDRYEILKLI